VDPAKLEEDRLERTMSGHTRSHKIIAATHATSPKRHEKQISGGSPQGGHERQTSGGFGQGGGRAPMKDKPALSGPVPEWKRAQMERDESEKKRTDEEERRKKQYVTQIVSSAAAGHTTVDTQSAVTQNFVDPLQAKAGKVDEAPPPPEKTAAQTFFDPADKEEDLKREEDYMQRRTGLAPSTSKKIARPAQPQTGIHEKDAHLALNPHMRKLLVIFVDEQGQTISEGGFMLRDGRLPVLAVENGLKVRDIKWKESGQALTAGPDGYSSVNFGTRDLIEVTGHKVISG